MKFKCLSPEINIRRESHHSFMYCLGLLSPNHGRAVYGTGKRDCMAHQMQHICYLAHYRKCSPTPDLGHCLLKEKSIFSYIDSHGLEEIRYFQRSVCPSLSVSHWSVCLFSIQRAISENKNV